MAFLILVSVVRSDNLCTHEKTPLCIMLPRIMDALEELVEIQREEYLDPLTIPMKENSCSVTRQCFSRCPCSITCGLDAEPHCGTYEKDYDGYEMETGFCECRKIGNRDAVVENAIATFCSGDFEDPDLSTVEMRAIMRFCRKWT